MEVWASCEGAALRIGLPGHSESNGERMGLAPTCATDGCRLSDDCGAPRPGEGQLPWANISRTLNIKTQNPAASHNMNPPHFKTQLYAKCKEFAHNNLSAEQVRQLKHMTSRLFIGDNLDSLAIFFDTDKNISHSYTKHYQHHFHPLRNKAFNLLEIGIGGYNIPTGGGHSLRMWKSYFPKANIYGLDIYDKSAHDEHRIKTYKGSQVDEDLLRKIVEDVGGIDVVIDDGSHINSHVIQTFQILFPLLSPNGIYAIEDLQTSYWVTDSRGVDWGGSSDLEAPFTSMNFLKRLIDGLNYEEFRLENYQPSYFDRHITSFHFYHNLAFIYKGDNRENPNRYRS
jgi:hypothetical protein